MGLSMGTNIVIFSVVFSVLDILAVFGRVVSRRKKPVPLGFDDCLILLGLLASISLAVLNITAVYMGGMGQHTQVGPNGRPLNPKSVEIYNELQWASEVAGIFALTFIRLSILFFYRRIFTGRIFNVGSWILVALTCIWGIAFFFATLLECSPISDAYTKAPGQPGSHCYPVKNLLVMFNATAITSFLLDVSILSLPQPMVWRLQMPLRQKYGISLIFLLGCFVTGISIARIVTFFHVSSLINSGSAFKDVQYETPPTLYWSQLECQVAVICACLPTMRPAFGMIQHAFQHLFESLRSRSSGHGRIHSIDGGPGNAPYQDPSSNTHLNGNEPRFGPRAIIEENIPLKDMSRLRKVGQEEIAVHKSITTRAERV